MIAGTHERHLQFQVLSRESNGILETVFQCEIGACQRRPGSPFEEAVFACRLIHQKVNAPLRLMMSGGVDSEAMALAFLSSGVPFSAVIFRFSGDLNQFDIKHAIEFCDRHRIPYRIVEFDILAFYESGKHLSFARAFRVSSPQFAAHLSMIDQVDGFPILSYNFLRAEKLESRKIRILPPKFGHFCYERFSSVKPNIGYFFLYTPELICSFFHLECYQKILFEEIPEHIDPLSYDFKCQGYIDGGFNIVPKAAKYTGFENVKLVMERIHQEQGDVYERHYRRPLEQICPEPQRVVFKMDRSNLFKSKFLD